MNRVFLTERLPSKRQKTVTISPELILSFLKIPPEGMVIDGKRLMAVCDAIPISARAVSAGVADRGDVVICVEDESFREMQHGSTLDEIRPTYSWETLNNGDL